MRTVDFAPLYRATVGFDRIADLMDRVLTNEVTQPTYPPYNIERTGENERRSAERAAIERRLRAIGRERAQTEEAMAPHLRLMEREATIRAHATDLDRLVLQHAEEKRAVDTARAALRQRIEQVMGALLALVGLMVLFGWTALVGVVRAEFLRARNFEYVRAAKALGVSDGVIMFRHVLPNAMVATLTMLPFIITGTIGSLATLDFLGFGLPSSAPSLGELTQQAKQNLQAPWLGFTAFFTFAIMLSLLVFVFEGVRDAFDPRKTFR